MPEKERVLGGVGTAVLSENDRVKIWEMRLEPGEESDVHEHTMDYILVVVEGDRIAATPEPDTKGYDKYIESEVYPGQIFYMKKGGIETAVNTGEKAFYEILIELKD